MVAALTTIVTPAAHVNASRLATGATIDSAASLQQASESSVRV